MMGRLIPLVLAALVATTYTVGIHQVDEERAKVDRLCAVLAHATTDGLVVWNGPQVDARAMAWVAVVQERYRTAFEEECR